MMGEQVDMVSRAREVVIRGEVLTDKEVLVMADEIERLTSIVEEFEHETAKAYGLLWRYLGTDKLPHRARGLLLPLIGSKGQERGIAFVKKQYGPVTDAEMFSIVDAKLDARDDQ